MMNKLWIALGSTMNKLWMSNSKFAINLWTTKLPNHNNLCTTSKLPPNNFVQLNHREISSAQLPVEQRGEQPVIKKVQQLLNKQAKVVHGTRTVFEHLFANPHLFKTTNDSSSAFHPGCTSPKHLNHNRFSNLSTIY